MNYLDKRIFDPLDLLEIVLDRVDICLQNVFRFDVSTIASFSLLGTQCRILFPVAPQFFGVLVRCCSLMAIV